MRAIGVRGIVAMTMPLAAAAMAATTELPLKEVTLFTSGVGYYEREAKIEGTASAALSFRTEHIADLIKSLVLMDDGGGTVTAVTYESRDPIEHTLQSFSVNLTDNPPYVELLNRMRGVTIRVKAGASDWTGEILGAEVHLQQIDEKKVVEEQILKVFAEGVIRSVNLASVQEIEVKDPTIRQDLAAALKALGGSLDRRSKAVKLEFQGEKARQVRIGYMLESPVWKTSYRLVLEEETLLLQGWAHIENTTDEDWTNVKLSLVSGRPISFVQNLYDPIYLRRPVVQNELQGSIQPQGYEGVMVEPSPAPPAEMMEGEDMAVMADAAPAAARGKARQFVGMGMAAEGRMDMARAPRAPMANAIALGGGAQAEGRAVGELFEYPIKDTVTLPRRQSAMIPILNGKVKGDKVSIFNERVDAKYPLNGVEMVNDSGLFLMQGPVTVFESGAYAGDARLTHTQRGEKKLLSYAVDLASEVKVDRQGGPTEVVSMKIDHGTLILRHKNVETAVYALQNKRDTARLFLLEHPIRPGWDLVAPREKDLDKTRDDYRFRVSVEAKKTREFKVVEENLVSQAVALSNVRGNDIEIYLKSKVISPQVMEALKKLSDLRRRLDTLTAQREENERKLARITAEQDRIRRNMSSVDRAKESYAMWEKKLVEQEKELETLTAEVDRQRQDELNQQNAIKNYLSNLTVE